jgi:hypothetical protein
MPDYLPLPEGDAWDDPDQWCPACECYHAADVPCSNESDPEGWGPDDVVGLGPEPGPDDAWYQELCWRADNPGHDPHNPWRD